MKSANTSKFLGLVALSFIVTVFILCIVSNPVLDNKHQKAKSEGRIETTTREIESTTQTMGDSTEYDEFDNSSLTSTFNSTLELTATANTTLELTTLELNSTAIDLNTTTEATTIDYFAQLGRDDDVKELSCCEKERCLKVSEGMRNLVDEAFYPCEDFYQYACGNSEGNPHVLQLTPQLQIDQHLKHALKTAEGPVLTFYNLCNELSQKENNDDVLEEARLLAKIMGDFRDHEVNTSHSKCYNDDKKNISHVSGLIGKLLANDFAPIFDMGVLYNKMEDYYELTIEEGYFFQSLKYYSDDEVECLKRYEDHLQEYRRENKTYIYLENAYKQYEECKHTKGIDALISSIKSSAQMVGFLKGNSPILEASDQEHFQGIEEFIRKLHNLTNTLKEKQKQETIKTSKRKTTKGKSKSSSTVTYAFLEFLDIWKNTNWASIIGESGVGKYLTPTTTEVIFKNADIGIGLLDFLDQEFSCNLVNLHKTLQALWYHNVVTSFGLPSMNTSRWRNSNNQNETCLHMIKHLAPLHAAAYIANDIGLNRIEEMKMQLNQTFKNVKDEILSEFYEIYINGPVLDRIKSTLERIVVEIHPEYDHYIQNKTALTLDNLDEDEAGNTYLKSLFNLRKKYRKEMYRMLSEKERIKSIYTRLFNQEDFSVFSDEARHISTKIILPFSAVISPNLDYSIFVPQYVNYAGLGYVITKEVLKALKGNETRLLLTDNSISIEYTSLVNVRDNHGLRAIFKSSPEQSKASNLELLASVIAWKASLGSADSIKQDLYDPSMSPTVPLIWKDGSPCLQANKTFLTRRAQMECQSSSDFDLVEIFIKKKLPARLRVNTQARSSELFKETFSCVPSDALFTSTEAITTTTEEPNYLDYVDFGGA